MLKKISDRLKLSYFSIYLLFIFMLLFSQLNIFIGNTPISLYRIFLIPILLILFFNFLYKKRFLIPKNTILFMFIFIIFASLNLEMKNLNSFIRILSIFIIFIITYNILFSIKFDKSKKLLLSYAIALVLFISSITMLTDYFHITKFLYIFNSDSYNDFIRWERPSSILGSETNFTAARFGALLPFLFYYILNERKNIFKLVFVLLTLFITVICQILTSSRMGYFTLLLIILLITYKIITKLNIKIVLIFLFILIILSLITFQLIKYQLSNSNLSWRMRNVEKLFEKKANLSKGDNSVAIRFILFVAGLDMIKKHPITGIGIGNSKYETLKYINEGYGKRYLHNTFLEIGAEIGIIPLVAFLLLYLSILIRSFSLSSKDEFWFFFSLSIMVQFVNFFFLSDFPNRVFWTILMPIGNIALIKGSET